MRSGFYKPKKIEENKRNPEVIVRAIYYASFEDEVVIEDYTGMFKCSTTKEFLRDHVKVDEKFKPKIERVKDGKGTGTGGY